MLLLLLLPAIVLDERNAGICYDAVGRVREDISESSAVSFATCTVAVRFFLFVQERIGEIFDEQ